MSGPWPTFLALCDCDDDPGAFVAALEQAAVGWGVSFSELCAEVPERLASAKRELLRAKRRSEAAGPNDYDDALLALTNQVTIVVRYHRLDEALRFR